MTARKRKAPEPNPPSPSPPAPAPALSKETKEAIRKEVRAAVAEETGPIREYLEVEMASDEFKVKKQSLETRKKIQGGG